MKRRIIFISAVLFIFVFQTGFSNAGDQDVVINIRNNTYFLESVRLTNLANLAFEEGNYIASTEYAMEAIHFASLSDEYVLLQLKIRETDEAIAEARRRLDFADAVNAIERYPSEYNRAQTAFNAARNFRAAEQWDNAIASANQVLAALAGISEEAPVVIVAAQEALPAEYTVRRWVDTGDSFWEIAGWSWVYNDSSQWRVLYEANRDRIPEANNPNLIHPGMIMLIPSLRGEVRQGMWDPGVNYQSTAGTVTALPGAVPAGIRFPGQYTVRPWAVSGDSFWVIAGWSWVYNDSSQWRVLYEANRDRIPDPNNPDLIDVGMIMVIPSLGGEIRDGMWDSNTVYPVFER